MEEQQAHELFTTFQAVDSGARVKQGLGFAGRGVAAPALKGWAEKDDDDVIARNRRMRYGGSGADAQVRACPARVLCIPQSMLHPARHEQTPC